MSKNKEVSELEACIRSLELVSTIPGQTDTYITPGLLARTLRCVLTDYEALEAKYEQLEKRVEQLEQAQPKINTYVASRDK